MFQGKIVISCTYLVSVYRYLLKLSVCIIKIRIFPTARGSVYAVGIYKQEQMTSDRRIDDVVSVLSKMLKAKWLSCVYKYPISKFRYLLPSTAYQHHMLLSSCHRTTMSVSLFHNKHIVAAVIVAAILISISLFAVIYMFCIRWRLSFFFPYFHRTASERSIGSFCSSVNLSLIIDY